jgi:rhamnosyltransferase
MTSDAAIGTMTAPHQPPTRENICAVIVTFHPDASFESRVERIRAQVARVIVVDNASSGAARTMLDRLAVSGRVDRITLDDNVGIAAALNRGLVRGMDAGSSWALTLDQDSLAHEEMVKELVGVYWAYPFRARLGVLGANYVEETTGTTALRKRAVPRESWLEVDEVITSGSLVSLAAFREVGPFREDLFIYYVDHEYCKRLRDAGYRVVLTREPLMTHQTGSSRLLSVGGREVIALNYPPWRSYYIVRNGLVIAKEHWRDDPRWALRRAHVVLKRIVVTLCFEEERALKLKYILQGVGDGLRGRTGNQVQGHQTGSRR